MLSRIERGLVSPSVETLERIAQGLGVPVPRFFGDQPSRTNFSHAPAGKGIRLNRFGMVAGHHYELLGHQLSGNLFVEPTWSRCCRAPSPA
jgi:transcriptional regulator with XRE-family HTH domain